jgi:anti-sigma regulatory factor (Ser/Thr protein kinase)
MTSQRSFAPTPESIREARRFVLDQLPLVPDSTQEAISLIVSELATNAIVHAATSFTVAVQRTTGSVRLEVRDQSDVELAPADTAPPPSELHGRGLFIVTQLASAWGVTPAAGERGKTVWVTIPLAPVVPAARTERVSTTE